MPDLIADLDARAADAGAAEDAYRRESRDRIAALEATRAMAHRRLGLMRGAIAVSNGAPDPAAAATAMCAHVADATGWDATNPAWPEFHGRLLELAEALVADTAHAATAPTGPDASGNRLPPPPPAAALEAFETWYRARFGSDFLALMGRDAPTFSPVVDF